MLLKPRLHVSTNLLGTFQSLNAIENNLTSLDSVSLNLCDAGKD